MTFHYYFDNRLNLHNLTDCPLQILTSGDTTHPSLDYNYRNRYHYPEKSNCV